MRFRFPLLFVGLVALLLGCSDDTNTPQNDSGLTPDRSTADAKTTGDRSGATGDSAAAAYKIGHMTKTYVDISRQSRKVATEIYYPADKAGDNVPAAKGPFPVVVFGHGRMGAISAYANFWKALVPAGFIVALPTTEMGMQPNHGALAKDFAFVAGQVAGENKSFGQILTGKVGNKVAMMGHSMGGATGLVATGESSSPFAALALFAPGRTTNPSSSNAAAKVTVPALLFGGGDDKLTPPDTYVKPYFTSLKSTNKTLVIITGGSHCQFSEVEHNCDTMEQRLGTPSLARDKQHQVTNTWLVPWTRWVLNGDTTAKAAFEALVKARDGVTVTQ